jgi:hypothetical protein
VAAVADDGRAEHRQLDRTAKVVLVAADREVCKADTQVLQILEVQVAEQAHKDKVQLMTDLAATVLPG